MRLVYNGPRKLHFIGMTLLVIALPVTWFYSSIGLSIALFGMGFEASHNHYEARWWQAASQRVIDSAIERALRAELPKLLNSRATRVDKLSDVMQQVVDEMKA